MSKTLKLNDTEKELIYNLLMNEEIRAYEKEDKSKELIIKDIKRKIDNIE